jgi:mannosyl-3-phosphoglycerate phosphatase
MTSTVIFTDLDGTLLDHESYEWVEAKPALDLCKERHVPVILVSSKTRAEMNPLRLELGLTSPFISENGGGIFFPQEGPIEPPPEAVQDRDLWKWSLGAPYPHLVRSLREIRDELGLPLQGFSDMTQEEIAELTGLEIQQSRLAAMREYDEPFVLPQEDAGTIDRLRQAALRRGYQVSTGGRFHHLHGAVDKGDAIQRLMVLYKARHGAVETVGLGDSPNDFSMLKAVDHPVLLGAPGRFPDLKWDLPRLRLVGIAGPRGWNEAVLELFTKGNTLAS